MQKHESHRSTRFTLVAPKATQALVTMAAILCLFGGCRPAATDAQATDGQRPQGDPQNREWVLVIARNPPTGIADGLVAEIGELISSDAKTGDVVTILEAPTLRTVSTFTIPRGNGRVRTHSKDMAPRVAEVIEFLRGNRGQGSEEPSQSGAEKLQLEVPAIPTKVQSLRRTAYPLRLILVGNPIYDDPRYAGLSFAGSRFPADGMLNDLLEKARGLPFLNGVDMLPEDTQVTWLTPSSEWGESHIHRQYVKRFWTLFFEKHNGALVGMSENAKEVFDRAIDGTQDAGTQDAPQNDDPQEPDHPGMLRYAPGDPGPVIDVTFDVSSASTPMAEPPPGNSEPPKELKRLIQETGSDKILIAINWVRIGAARSAATNCDMDLWVNSGNGQETLFFQNMKTSFGELNWDRRVPGSIEGNPDLASWECARIGHNRLTDLSLWINAFETDGPVRIRLIVVWQGKQREVFYNLDVAQGDRADGYQHRESSPAWMKVNLGELFK